MRIKAQGGCKYKALFIHLQPNFYYFYKKKSAAFYILKN